jgi:hypothetical protein
LGTQPYNRPRDPRRARVVIATALALTASACAADPGPIGNSPRPVAALSATPTLSGALSPSASPTPTPSLQPAFALTARLLDAQSAPSGYQVLPASAFSATGAAPASPPPCSSAAFGNPYVALTTVRPADVAERGIDGPGESGGFFWRGTEQLFGYHGDGAQQAMAAVRHWVARCAGSHPGASIGPGPKLGDDSLTLHVSISVRTSSASSGAPFDSVVVRAGTVVFVVSEQGVPATGGADDNAARLTAVVSAAYSRFQHS